MHGWFFIDPPQVSLNLLPHEFHSHRIMLTINIMKDLQKKNLLKIQCCWWTSAQCTGVRTHSRWSLCTLDAQRPYAICHQALWLARWGDFSSCWDVVSKRGTSYVSWAMVTMSCAQIYIYQQFTIFPQEGQLRAKRQWLFVQVHVAAVAVGNELSRQSVECV